MLFSKTLSLLLLCLFLTACGFRPLYMAQDGKSTISYPLKIETIKDREGQILRNYLVDLLTPEGRPPCPLYSLCIVLTDTIKSIGINKDETTSRKEATLTATLTLRDLRTNKVVYTHSVKAINSFAVISENYYSNLVAEQYSKKEATRLLAEKIKLVISAYLDAHCEL